MPPPAGLILADVEAVDKDHPDFLPQMKGVVNFHKRRQFGRIIQQLQKYQSIPYNFHPIEVSIPGIMNSYGTNYNHWFLLFR